MKAIPVVISADNGHGPRRRYSSLRAASRVLSGNGTDRVRSAITECGRYGGSVCNGKVWVRTTR